MNVLCEGPSVLEASREHLLPGPVVAVNRAIALSRVFPIDVWASTDDPRLLWGWGSEHLRREVKLLSSENTIPIWHQLIGKRSVNRRLYAPLPVFMEAVEETGEGYVGEDGKAPLVPTVMHVIGWLSRMNVKHVRLFGCDMRGEGSPLHISFSEEAGEGSRFRWSVERSMIGLFQKSYRQSGKLLERWKPAKEKT